MSTQNHPTLNGLADRDPRAVGARVDAAFAAFLDLAGAVDLDAATRLPGWRAREVLVHLGAWSDGGAIAAMTAAALARQAPGPASDPDHGNAAVIAEHAGATRSEILAALEANRAAAAGYFARPDVAALGSWPVSTPVGTLPTTSAVHTICFELAVHALDLAAAGAPRPPSALLDAGLAALIDVLGSLAAAAHLAITVTAQDPVQGGWRCTSGPDGWCTTPALGAPPAPHTAVVGSAADLLEIASGRANAVTMLASRRIRVEDLPTFLRLAPLVESVPHLPGGAALRGAGAVLRSAGGLVARLPFFRR